MTDGHSRAYSTFFGILFIALLLLFVYSVAEILLLFFVAIIFAIYLAWITEIFQRRLGAPRWLGLLAALTITMLGVTGIGWLMIPPLVAQTQELITALPTRLQEAEALLMALAERSAVVRDMLPEVDRAAGESYAG